MKILEIIEGGIPQNDDRNYYNGSDGVLIKTDAEDIRIGIDGYQSCCEHFGYNLLYPNDLKAEDFIGEEIMGVFAITECPADLDSYAYNDGVTYGVATNKGVIVLNVFNSHNGYYGHGYSFTSKNINESGTL